MLKRTIGYSLRLWLTVFWFLPVFAQVPPPDERGNILPDFSRVGYYQGLQPIPDVPIVKELSPGPDDEKRIQEAIDEISQLPLQASGFRGALLLKKGRYSIKGTIFIKASGIVLRGEGDSTILVATEKGKRDLIRAAGQGKRQEKPDTRKKVTNRMVPVGSFSVHLNDTRNLSVGDHVVLFRPGTQAWIHALKMDQIDARENTQQWKPEEYNLSFERRITAIRGNQVTLDNPVMMELNQQFGGAELFVYSAPGRLSHIGIEKLSCESEYKHEEDEDHGWVAVSFNRIENSWVSELTSRYFGYSSVHLGDEAKQITVRNSRNIDPKSKITGSRRYSFNNDGQLNLFINCYASGGRHDFITGARVCGPNVFYNCRAEQTHADIGPHHRWSVGTLYDHIETDGEINIQDRGNWGTGHGWAGVTQVLWHSRAKTVTVQTPWASGKNYAIGVLAEKTHGRLSGRLDGIWLHHNDTTLKPASLFTTQKAATYSRLAGKLEKEVINTLRPGILEEAAWAMQQEPVTITAYPASRSAGTLHDFYSEGDYWWPNPKHIDSPYIRKDGLSNPDNFTAHREAMIRFSRIVGALASAYRITGDINFAQKIMEHCRAWFTHPATRMNPSLLYAQAIKGRATGRGIGIIDTIHLMEVVMGLLAIEEATALDRESWTGIRSWFGDYIQWLTSHPYGIEEREALNNHGTCWVMQVAVFAKFTGNTKWQNYCRDRFKTVLLPKQMAGNGSFPLELSRTKPYGYSIFNLDAMAVIAQILRTPDENLWSFEHDKKSLKTGIQFLYPFIQNKKSWPYAKDVMYWDQLPVAPPFLVLGALAFQQTEWLRTWIKLDHYPTEPELLRNMPVRNPLLWF